MHVDMAKKIYEDKLNANFPKIRFTYIKLRRNFCKQCAPNFIYANLLQYKIIWTGEQENRGTGKQGKTLNKGNW